MRLILFPLLFFTSASVFAVTDSSIGTGNLFSVTTNPYSGYSPLVVGTSCSDIAGRMNNSRISNDSSLPVSSLIHSFTRASQRNTRKNSYNCFFVTGDGIPYTAAISTGEYQGLPDFTSTTWDVVTTPNCPSARNFYLQSVGGAPPKLCSAHGSSYCGWENPSIINDVVGGSVLYSLSSSFSSEADCSAWVSGGGDSDTLTPATLARLESKIEQAMLLTGDEIYTEDSRSALFDVVDSINQNYPEKESTALAAISDIDSAISALKKVDGSDPDPSDPDLDVSGIISAIEAMSDRISADLSDLRSAISDLSFDIVSGLSELAYSIDSSLGSNFSALFDKLDDHTSSINDSVSANGAKLDLINENVSTSSAAISSKLDDINNSNQSGFSDVVSAINAKELSVDVGDVSVSLDDSNIVSELKGISSKLDNLFSSEGSEDYELLGTPSNDPRFLAAEADASSKLTTLSGMLGFSDSPPPSDFSVDTGIYGEITIPLSEWHPLMYIFKWFFQLTVLFYCFRMLSRTVENY